MKEIVFFDVCGTLYNSNTTYDFYKFLFKNHKRRNIFCTLFNSKPSKVLWKSLMFIGLSKVPRRISLSFLWSLDVNYVKEMADIFVEEVLEPLKNNELHQKLIDARSNGATIVLISASIEPVVEAIAKRLGNISFICTTLHEVEGKYTGFIKEDVEGLKLNKVEEKFNLSQNTSWFYTDNKEDLPLLIKVTHPNIVLRKKGDIIYWEENLKQTNATKYEFLD